MSSNDRMNDINRVVTENENSSQKYLEFQNLRPELSTKNENPNIKSDDVLNSEENFTITNGNEDNLNIDANTIRQKLYHLLNNGQFKKASDTYTSIFSLTIFIIYVVSTYYPEKHFTWFDILNYVIATIFNLETILHLYLAQHRVQYLLQIETIVKLITSIFPYFASIDNLVMSKIVESSRIFHVFRITWILEDIIKNIDNIVVKHIYNMIVTFITLIVICACMFRVVEIDVINEYMLNPDYRSYGLNTQTKFHDFLYYMIVTIPTVGYGDIYPISEQGRVVMAILIVASTFLISKGTGILLILLETVSVYSRETYKANNEIPHIIVCGKVTVDAMKNFCNELFHTDHGQSEKNVVILDKSSPGMEMRVILHSGKYKSNLKYLEGDPFSEADLDRADITKAKAIVIMTDKYTTSPEKIDLNNIHLAMAIKKYLLKKNIDNSTIYIQLIKPQNKIHYSEGVGTFNISNKVPPDRMIILEEIKMNLLSKSCLIPGIIPLIANLVRSSGAASETEFDWLNEYLEGSEQEIYRAPLNEEFKNNTFAQISKIIYKNYDAIAFALEIEVDGKTTISLNPGGFFIEKFIQPRNDIMFFIYVICSDKEVADRIARADEYNGKVVEVEEENSIFASNKKIKESKVQNYMKLKLNDIIKLEENIDMKRHVSDEEDNYFFNNNTMGTPPDVKKDSIRNSTIYNNHIVVCGTHQSLYYYLLPLRAKYFGRENLKYVVILTQEMPKDLWDSISRFENIILINGSPDKPEDLLRANIEYAYKAVILEDDDSKEKDMHFKLVDRKRMFIYKAIKKCNPRIQILTELVYQANIEFLLPKSEIQRMNYKAISYEQTSIFSSGGVYMSSIIDTLTCQAYYNKHIVTIIHQLLTGSKSNMNTALRKICEIIGLRSSNLWQINVPERFINKTFSELYDEFCDLNLIILGLYRLPGVKDNDMPYVYTKPEPETRLTHKDKVFVLSIENINKYFQDEKKEEDKKDSEKKGNKVSIQNEDYPKTNGSANSPFSYLEKMVEQMEQNTNSLETMLNEKTTVLHDSIASGVRQEISGLLQ